MARAPKHVIRQLKEIRRLANYERAGFSTANGTDVTALVKESTRLHRETWILPPLDALIAWAEGRDA